MVPEVNDPMNGGLLLFIKRINAAVESVISRVLLILIVALITVVTIQVLNRWFFQSPLLWTVDVSLLLLVWSVLLGAALGVRHGAHYVVDVLPRSNSGLLKALDVMIHVIIISMGLVYAVEGYRYAMAGGRRLLGMTGIRAIWAMASMPVYGVLSVSFILERLLAQVGSHSRLGGTSSDSEVNCK